LLNKKKLSKEANMVRKQTY